MIFATPAPRGCSGWGYTVMEIRQLRGHKTPHTTRSYINIRTEELRRAVNLLQSTKTTQQSESEISLSGNFA
jgi:hypothetical protein